jgi:hypothetical protein
MGCEPRGFGWSATVEVCSVRVTRLVTDQEKSKKFSDTQLVPGTGLGLLVPGLLASRPVPAGAWHRASGRDLPALRIVDRKGA